MEPKESLEIIGKMVSDTRRSVLQQSYVPFLTWGGATIVVALIVYSMLKTTGYYYSYFLWYLIPCIGLPLTQFFMPKTKLIKTGISNSLRSIWQMFAVLLVCFSVASFFVSFNILFFILLLLSIGSYVSGAVISYSFLKYSSIPGFLISALLLLIHGEDRILVFAVAIVVIMIIPGLKMKQDLQNL